MSDHPVLGLLLDGPRPTRNRRRNPLWRFRRLLFLVGLFGLGALLGGVLILSQIELDLAADDVGELAQTTYVCTAEIAEDCGPDVATAQFSAGEDREIVSYEQVPDVVIWAVVATEDKDFFTHHGIDPWGISRAVYQDIRNQSASQGGSTITQQYVKNAFTGADRTIVRKLREATLAVKLEREWTKEEILERYLNRIYFGRGSYGIQAAAQNYFGKDVEELDLADAAFLAGLIRAPSRADPAINPDEATRRRATTLVRMVADGYITQAQADEANQRDWSTTVPNSERGGLGEVRGAAFGSEYFVEAVRQELALLYPDGELYTGGLRVYTTLDPELQRAAYTTAAEVVDPTVNPDDPAASIVAVDANGLVLAMMGGYDFEQSQVNLATGRAGGGSGRQPGSAFKVFALAEALEQGYSSGSFFSAPSSIVIPNANDGADWDVSGGGSPDGYRDLVDGLRVSSNVVYAQLMVELGPSSVVELSQRLGVSADLPSVNSLVLGSGEVSVLDMAAAYATIANQGVRYQPVFIERIEHPDGSICWYPSEGACASGPGRSPTVANALEPSIAQQVTYAMTQVVNEGTGQAAAAGLPWPVAGKTGTTQDNRDAWFVGFTCDLTAAVWMGHTGAPGEPVRTMADFRGESVSGGGLPAELWNAFLQKVVESEWASGNEPCQELATRVDSEGLVLNEELSTTTLPPCLEQAQPRSGGSTTESSTTGPSTTQAAGQATTTDPDETSLPPPTTQPCQPRPDSGGLGGNEPAGDGSEEQEGEQEGNGAGEP